MNNWFKLALVSLVGMIMSILMLSFVQFISTNSSQTDVKKGAGNVLADANASADKSMGKIGNDQPVVNNHMSQISPKVNQYPGYYHYRHGAGYFPGNNYVPQRINMMAKRPYWIRYQISNGNVN